MKRRLIWLGSLLVLFGCASGFHPFTKDSPAPSGVAQNSMQEIDYARPCYDLEAKTSGPCINFCISNHGTKEIAVTPDDFLLIPQGTKQRVPYDPQVATIEVPAQVQPGETIRGRALFNDFKNPSGSRLVFKPREKVTPDDPGTFAIVDGEKALGSAKSPTVKLVDNSAAAKPSKNSFPWIKKK